MWFRRPSVPSVLQVLDECAKAFTFPALDNGYVYLAATRLTGYHAPRRWALVIEVFGFSPRAGLPDVAIYTFASEIENRKGPEQYVSREAYEEYLSRNSHNELGFVFPIAEGDWQDRDNPEVLSREAAIVPLRGASVELPSRDAYERSGIELEDPAAIQVFELCRFLAETRRDDVLASASERRTNVAEDLRQVLLLEQWNHPDIVAEARPSESKTFRQIARVLETGDANEYQPTEGPNTHWSNWPEGGLL